MKFECYFELEYRICAKSEVCNNTYYNIIHDTIHEWFKILHFALRWELLSIIAAFNAPVPLVFDHHRHQPRCSRVNDRAGKMYRFVISVCVWFRDLLSSLICITNWILLLVCNIVNCQFWVWDTKEFHKEIWFS